MEWQNIVTLIVAPLLGYAAGILRDILTGRSNRQAKRIEGDTTLESKKIETEAALESKRQDELAAFRRELRAEVDELKKANRELLAQLRHLDEQIEDKRVYITDLKIALARYVSRVDECAEIISGMLEEEERLDKTSVRKAKAILTLIDRDRGMREQMRLDEKTRTEQVG